LLQAATETAINAIAKNFFICFEIFGLFLKYFTFYSKNRKR
jgi:hypothetical protein